MLDEQSRLTHQQRRPKTHQRNGSKAARDYTPEIRYGREIPPALLVTAGGNTTAVKARSFERGILDEGICQEPVSSDACSESDSDSSMTNNAAEQSPRYSEHGIGSPKNTAFSKLSLDEQPPCTFAGGPHMDANNSRTTCAKRCADRDITPRPYKQSLMSDKRKSPAGSRPIQGHTGYGPPYRPMPQDSGYVSAPPSRQNTVPIQDLPPPQASSVVPSIDAQRQAEPTPLYVARGSQDPDDGKLLKELRATPLTFDQLAAEIKLIYGGLVVVERKCISICAAQDKKLDAKLTPEQMQALIALHRTLLYEHHDFLMATQHPSATDMIRELAMKYRMPARMWQHGIHAFLEVLRKRLPDSHDHMLAFLYLAYQMMALMYETAPVFKDLWLECLGDLARYRMAIENDKELHTLWSGVAADWYITGSERQPATGRLYHHLGILERPSLRKLFLYGKSLTCVTVFPNARASLANFCRPIANPAPENQHVQLPAEGLVAKFHAWVFDKSDTKTAQALAAEAIASIEKASAIDLRNWGVYLIGTNIAAVFEFGLPTNRVRQAFDTAVNRYAPKTVPQPSDPSALTTTSAPQIVHDFCYSCFNALLRHQSDTRTIHHLLGPVHAILAWLFNLVILQQRAPDVTTRDTAGTLLNNSRFDWDALASFLNRLLQTERIESRTIQYARQGVFPIHHGNTRSLPLPEDYHLRGLIWTFFYFPAGRFDDERPQEDRMKEDEPVHKFRVVRVQWLAVILSTNCGRLRFDHETKKFSAPVAAPAESLVADGEEYADDGTASNSSNHTPQSRSSMAFSQSSSGTDGFVHVRDPR